MSSIPDRIEDLHNRLAQLEAAQAARVKPAELAPADRFVTRAELDELARFLIEAGRAMLAVDPNVPPEVRAALERTITEFKFDEGRAERLTGTEA